MYLHIYHIRRILPCLDHKEKKRREPSTYNKQQFGLAAITIPVHMQPWFFLLTDRADISKSINIPICGNTMLKCWHRALEPWRSRCSISWHLTANGRISVLGAFHSPFFAHFSMAATKSSSQGGFTFYLDPPRAAMIELGALWLAGWLGRRHLTPDQLCRALWRTGLATRLPPRVLVVGWRGRVEWNITQEREGYRCPGGYGWGRGCVLLVAVSWWGKG